MPNGAGSWPGSFVQKDLGKRTTTFMTAMGVVMIAFGVLAVIASFLATVTAVVILGVLLLAAGVVHFFDAFSLRGWRNVMPAVAVGIVYAVVGLMLLSRPSIGAAGLTLMIAAFFFMSGLVRIVSSLMLRYPSWGYTFVSGIAAVVLGLIVFGQWPASSLWLIGTLIGIELLLGGGSLVGTASIIRRAAKEISAVPEEGPPAKRPPPEARPPEAPPPAP